jgi:carbonic anhydrase
LKGNLVNPEPEIFQSHTIASFEYAVANLGTPLIFVLGDQACRAEDATIEQINPVSFVFLGSGIGSALMAKC